MKLVAKAATFKVEKDATAYDVVEKFKGVLEEFGVKVELITKKDYQLVDLEIS